MASDLRIRFLGGLGEVGRNCMVVEEDSDAFVIDAGLQFAGPEALDAGAERTIVPDLSALGQIEGRLRGVLVTHGHLDHVGAIPALAEAAGCDGRLPVYGSYLALAYAALRLNESKMADRVELRPFKDGARFSLGHFGVEPVAMTHSIPQACGYLVTTRQGLVLHTGDFKLDAHPLDGRRSDLERIGRAAATEGISLLLADSTNALVPGRSGEERDVETRLAALMKEHAERRIVVACFASNLHRLGTLTRLGQRNGRRVALVGSSMLTAAELSRLIRVEGGPTGRFVDPWRVDDHGPGEVLLLATGSQGEAEAALFRMAKGARRVPRLGPDDVVIFSSSVIPGNEANVERLIAALGETGATVLGPNEAAAHVSGHACRDELVELLSIARPRGFVPVHGTAEMLEAHAELAEEAGVGGVAVVGDGDGVVLGRNGLAVDLGELALTAV